MYRWLARRAKDRSAWSKAETNNFTERLVTVSEPGSAAAEAYRTLRANLLHALVDAPPKVVVLTSPGPREGKSITCANLGIALAQANKNTLVIDCDFRKPALHKYFGLRNTWGIVNVLTEERNLQEVWDAPVEGLKVVPVGAVPPNSAELLDSQRFAEILAGVREEFDYVLLDASPIGMVSDSAILATQSDGVLLVLDEQNTHMMAVRQSVRNLQIIGANILGTVLNNVKVSDKDYYNQYKY